VYRLYLPGGSLDSQTTETQWYDAQFDSGGRESETSNVSSRHESRKFFVPMMLIRFLIC
jgi:hypothetical protein